ncbi:TPA: DUF4329 domain-containing protein [Pseudomonas putida]|nr:DUF4329 domain-containing protein [Pseudomonas putida]
MSDMSGREPRAAVLSRRKKLPKLSHGFLTEEDAAYWVHSRIPTNADREYGSVILQTPDGDFVATTPLSGEANQFDLGTILDVDSKNNYLHPEGYTCVANVHSHPPVHDKIREANPGQGESINRLFLNFFSDMDFIADVAERSFFRSAYLSGPDGLLLKYSPSGSKEEFSYYLWLRAGAPRGNPVGVFGVVNIIKKVASLGDLRVVVSNADWGNCVGKVPADWAPGADFSKGKVTALPLMTSIYGNAERAVFAALEVNSAQTFGLVLKSTSARDYVATHARPAGAAAWDPTFFFPRRVDGSLELPSDYALEGFYFASRPDPSQFPPRQPWLYENFFTPEKMALAIASYNRAKHRDANGSVLSLYMKAGDSSILKYRFSGSQLEKALSEERPDGTIGDGGRQGKMQSGALTPREYVTQVVLAGQLEVLRGSALWAPGPVAFNWAPFAGFSWPMLGPTFLSADDAARLAHNQIASRRDRQFAGYIFQTSDKRFVATVPLEGTIESFSLARFYPRDNAGRSIFPDDLVLQSHYVSHKALSLLDPEKVERLKWSRQEAALSLQMFNVEELRQVFLDEIPLYLSGAQKSLVRFQPFETKVAQEFAKRLGTLKHPGPLAVELETGITMPSSFIRELSAVGRLTVVVNSDLWGPRGQVTSTWAATVVPWKWKRPEHVAFGAVFPSADEAAEDQYSRDVRLQDQEKAWFGFILKHKDREEYVATELIPIGDERNDVFQSQSLFGVSRVPPWYRYPEGFSLYAHFYSRQRLKHPPENPGSWFSQYFIPPQDLFVAVYTSRHRSIAESANPIVLYISTQDGALLKFDNRFRNKLFDNDTSDMGLEDFQRKLSSGEMKPEDFVRVVALHGGLSVMRTSLCWDEVGPVDMNWQPYGNLQRRWLSPAFHFRDDAVIYARSRLPEDTGKIFGGLLLIRKDGLYLTTEPVEVSSEDFDISEIFPVQSVEAGLFPAGCQVTGRYRSRSAREPLIILSSIQKQVYLNMLSVETLFTAFARPRLANPWAASEVTEYLLGPDGSLISYRSGLLTNLRKALSETRNDWQTLPFDLDGKTIKQQFYNGKLKPSEWVNCLAQSGTLQVVKGSELWGRPGTVKQWEPFHRALSPGAGYAKAVVSPASGPVFIQDNAAARHVHKAPNDQATATFGFILWNVQDGVFFASLPVDVQHSRMALDRVFPRGVLPSKFKVHALYLCAQKAAEGEPGDESRAFFFSPLDIQQVCAAAHTPQGYRTIYFSCADGALLRFVMRSFEPGEFYDAFGQVELRPNQFASLAQATQDESDISRGRFHLPEYVRRMARAGRLEVIETSDYWSRHGVIDDVWQPRMANISSQVRWAADPVPSLGPVFHHCDDAARYIQQRAGSGYVFGRGFEGAVLARNASLAGAAACFVPLEPLMRYSVGDDPVDRIFRTSRDPSTTSSNPAPSYPEGYELVAAHQLHLSGNTTFVPDHAQVGPNFAAPPLVFRHTHDLKSKGFEIKDYYYTTPHGVLLKYTPSYTETERYLLLSKPFEYGGGKWIAKLAPEAFISRLVELGEFRVLIPGYYWRVSGRLGKQWRERRQQLPAHGIVRVRDEL